MRRRNAPANPSAPVPSRRSDDGSGVGAAEAEIVAPVASNRAPVAIMRKVSLPVPLLARVFTAKEAKPPLIARRNESPKASENNASPGMLELFAALKKE